MDTTVSEAVVAVGEPPAAPLEPSRRRGRLTGIAAGLAAANVLGAATGFITGPLMARALGASGRGDVAAILVPLSLVPGVLALGIPAYAYREIPRGRPVGEVIGSLSLPVLMMGLLTAAGGIPLADALAGGRPTVRTFLIVVFLSTPLILIGRLLYMSLSAAERWRAVMITTLTPFLVALIGIGAMYAAGDLTVATAAAVTIAGALLSVAPGIPFAAAQRPVFRSSIARAGISFGLKSWIGGLAQMANARLDQFLMITVVAPRELGLYAVATTISGASGLAAGGLAPPLMARIAAGETWVMAQAVRIMLMATALLNVALAAATPVLLSVVFGSQFRPAFAMALILLAAQIPLIGASVLSGALQADGAPLIPTLGEAIALLITAVGLVLLLRPLGGVGAAIVSCAAYSASFAVQVAMARRRIGVPLREFLVPTTADVSWIRARVTEVTRRRTVDR